MRLPNESPRLDDYQPRDLDPIAEHHHHEALASLMARTQELSEINRVEGRILQPKTPAHHNPHD